MIYTHAYLFAKPLIARVRCRVRRSRHADSVSMTNAEKPPPQPGPIISKSKTTGPVGLPFAVSGNVSFFSHVSVIYAGRLRL